MFFQIPRSPFNDFMLLIIIPIAMILSTAILFKIGLKLTKAEIRNGFKWILISLGIQIGVIVTIVAPLLLIGMNVGFQGFNPSLVIPLALLALFMDWNVINVIHQLGMKRSFLLLILMIIPLAIFGFILVTIIITTRLF